MDRIARTYIFEPKGPDMTSLRDSPKPKKKLEKPAQEKPASGNPGTSSTSPLRQETNSNEPADTERANLGSKLTKFLKPSTYKNKKYDRI